MSNVIPFGHRARHPREALRALLPLLKGTAAQVFLCLVAHCDERQECYPGLPTIAATCGLKDLRAVRAALQQLTAAGVIRGHARRGKSTTWRVLDAIDALPRLVPAADPGPGEDHAPPASTYPGRITQGVEGGPGEDHASDPSRQPHHEVGQGSGEEEELHLSRTSTKPKPRKARTPKPAKAYPPEARVFVRAFRMAYLENADPDYGGFHEPLPASELEAATRLLAAWSVERVTAAIQLATRDKPNPARGWQGWPARVRSVAKLEQHWGTIDQQARAASVSAGRVVVTSAAPTPHDLATFRANTFSEWQASVARCAHELKPEDFADVAALNLAARRAASARGYRWEMDPPPPSDSPGSFPWKGWR